jgi:ketosteroid isomerase-like protein
MSSTIESNRALAIKFIERMKPCDGIDEALISDDFRWWAPGLGYSDKTQMKALIAQLKPILPRMPDMTIVSSISEGDRVALEVSGKCELANGRRYDNEYHFLITVRDGRVHLVKEYTDTKLAHDTFGKL